MSKQSTREQLQAIYDAAEQRLRNQLIEDGFDLEVEPALLAYRTAARPALSAVRKRIGNPNEYDLVDQQGPSVWLRFWEQHTDLLATRALGAARSRWNLAKAEANEALNVWHKNEHDRMMRADRQRALNSAQREERRVFKKIAEYIDAAGHKVVQIQTPDLLEALRRGDLGDVPNRWIDS